MKSSKQFYYAFVFLTILTTQVYYLLAETPLKFEKTLEQTNFFLSEGSRFNLRCPLSLAVSKEVEVSWLHNDQPISRHALVLSMPGISRIDAGIYRCLVQNEIGKILSPIFNLTVVYLEGFADEPSSFYDIKIAPNKFAVLKPPQLVGKGLVDVRWKWFFEEKELTFDDATFITNYGELVLLEIRDRYGNYYVKAHTKAGDAYSKNYRLSEDTSQFPHEPQFAIVYPPRDLQVNFQSNTNLPSFFASAKFECVPTNWGTKPFKIQWFLNNERLNEGVNIHLEQSNRRLVISNVGEFVDLSRGSSHSITIRCLVKTTDGLFQDHANVNLEIFASPKIENNDDNESQVSKSIGDSVSLVCKEGQAWPRSKIFWYFNGVKLSNFSSNTYNVDNIQQKDFGFYQCEASNIIGFDIAQFWLKTEKRLLLHNRVEIVEAPVDAIVKVGEEIVLPCKTRDSTNVFVTWNLNGSDLNLSDQRIHVSQDSLTISNAKLSDSGTYKCLAKSDGGISTADASSKITVIGANLIQYGPSNQSVLIGSNIQMPCKLANDYANRNDVVVSWFRNNQEIPTSGDTLRRISFNDEGNLLIYQVGPENIGIYSCVARTADSRSESATASLRLIEKPSMPQNVTVVLLNDTLPNKIRISWRPGFDGNSPITKHVVEMRTMGANGLWSDWETVVDNIPFELCCSIVVDSVKPSEEAAFRVIASNRHGAGKPSVSSRTIKIPQQPPADAPRQVAASARSSSSVMVQWQPPLAAQWNGDIKGYMIRYRLSGYATVDWNEKNVSNEHARNALIESLITWREYDIQVAAFNDRGLGVYSKPIEVTTLEGMPIQAPQNVAVDVLNSTSIQISFKPPDQQMIPGVNLGYKIDFWKNGYSPKTPKAIPFKTVRVFFPEFSRISQRVDNLEKFGHYNVTVLCFTAPGDGPRSDPIEVITMEDVPGPPASINLSKNHILYSSAFIKWEPPIEPNGFILKYIIRHWKMGENEKHTVEVSGDEDSLIIDGLTPSTRYAIDIQAVTKVGGGPRVEASFESGVTPELPDRPQSLLVSDIGSRSVVLEFVPGFDGHSFIKRWIVEAKQGSSSIFSVIFNTSLPNARSFIVTDLRPHNKYQLRLIAENVRGRSAPSEPSRSFETSQTFPENAPEKVYAEPISARQIQISWTPLLPTHWNGDPIGYLIFTRTVSHINSTIEPVEWKEHMVSNIKASDFTLFDLKPFTLYQVKVSAKNAFGISNFSDVVVATTYESAPSGTLNVFADLDKKKVTISIRWSELNVEERNGRILGYMVRLVPEKTELRRDFSTEKQVLGADVLFTEITNLRAFTTFHVFVSAFNLVGEGPSNENPPLVLTSESLPGKPSNVSFTYKSTTEVRLSWQKPVEANGQIINYGIRYWRVDQSEEDAVNTQIPHNVKIFSATSLTPETTYHFAIKAENVLGWGAERRLGVTTTSHNAPLPVPSIPSRNVLRSQYPNKIYLIWSASVDEQGRLNSSVLPIRGIELEYRSNELKFGKDKEHFWEKNPLVFEPDSDDIILPNLIPNTAYKTRIRFIGDFSKSSWSYESDWIKTAEAVPSSPPDLLQVSPYESFSALVKWRSLERQKWNSDKIGYRILYQIYPSDDDFNVEDVLIPETVENNEKSNEVNKTFQHVLTKFSSFRHYVVKIKSVNAIGASKSSAPMFVYVGYSVPKEVICNIVAESLTSTSIRLSWDKRANASNNHTNELEDSIGGYKIRYTSLIPSLSFDISMETLGMADSTEEIVITDKNEHTLIDLRKFTEYQISVSAYNRAGEGQSTAIRIKTLEDCPGPVESLIFQDILLDSVNVSWSPPLQPNGIIQGYVVNYQTYKISNDYRKEIREKTHLTYLLAENLEENVTYHFYVRAETSAGLGVETSGNVIIGYNPGAPLAVDKPVVILEHSTFLLKWKSQNLEQLPVKGHLIQAKRVATVEKSENNLSSSKSMPISKKNYIQSSGSLKKRQDTFGLDSLLWVNESNSLVTVPVLSALTTSRVVDTVDFRPRHSIGTWFTLSSVLGDEHEYRISYRQLEPSSYYVFRLFARNKIGVGLSSAESDQLFVPALLPEDPFWNQWWFLVIVGLVIVLVVFIFIATLCFTNNAKDLYKSEKNDAFDTLQLSDGGIVSYELHSKHLKRAEDLSRPNTHTSWVSAGNCVPLRFDNTLENTNNINVYGSIGSGLIAGGIAVPAVSSMYQALATDALPPDVVNSSSVANDYFGKSGDMFMDNNFVDDGGANDINGYMSRYDFENTQHTNNGYESNRNSNASPLPNFGSETSNYQLRDFNAASKFRNKNSDALNKIINDSTPAEQSFANHYQSNDEARRTTWRRTRQQATAQQLQKGSPVKNAVRRPASAHQSNGNFDNSELFDPYAVNNIQSSASYSCLNQMPLVSNKTEANKHSFLPQNNDYGQDNVDREYPLNYELRSGTDHLLGNFNGNRFEGRSVQATETKRLADGNVAAGNGGTSSALSSFV